MNNTPAALAAVYGGMYEAEDFTRLAGVVRTIGCMPASSAAVERAFSASGRVCTPRRAGLSGARTEQLTVVQQHIMRRLAEGASMQDVHNELYDQIK